jgi:putative transposase
VSRENRQHRRKSFNLPGHAHELTFSCYRRFQFLSAERTCLWLAEAIEAARVQHDFDVWAFVFMPEHAHLIVRPRQPEYRMSAILSGLKLPVGRRAVAYLISQQSPWLAKITRRRRGREERLFWQSGGGYDRNITCGKTLLQMIDYLHHNPVQRGLVERACEWRWSSAAHYEGGESPIAIDRIPPEWLIE